MEHNKYTKASVLALLIAAVLNMIVVGSILYNGISEFKVLINFLFFSSLAILFNLFFAYKVHKANFTYVKYAFWIYLIQIFGFESSHFGFSLIAGFRFFITWSIDDFALTINLFALFMSVLLLKAMRDAGKPNK